MPKTPKYAELKAYVSSEIPVWYVKNTQICKAKGMRIK